MAQQTLEQPICKVSSDGTKRWYLHDKLHKLHRIDGPAVEFHDGSKYWYQNDLLHRIDGPAIELSSGEKHWYQNGKRHRINGPAIEFLNGTKCWYLNGEKVTQQDIMKLSPLIMFMII